MSRKVFNNLTFAGNVGKKIAKFDNTLRKYYDSASRSDQKWVNQGDQLTQCITGRTPESEMRRDYPMTLGIDRAAVVESVTTSLDRLKGLR